MDRRIQEVRQRIARRTSTGNQVIGGNQNLQDRISAIRSQVNNNNNTNMSQPNYNNNYGSNTSPFIRRQSSNYSMQGDGNLDQTASFGGGYQDDFVEWLKDEATRLNIFGDKLVIEVMKAHERMAKEEKEKDKKEKKEEN